MAVRPPQGDSDDSDLVEFGIVALEPKLDEEAFPATGEELVEALGDPSIPTDASGNTVSLSQALSHLPETAFDSKRELLDRLHPVFEQYRASNGGFLTQLRGLLPF